MSTPTVTIIETGIANIASIAAGFRRCGAGVETTDDPEIARQAELLVLPGVGAFEAGMQTLNSLGLADVLRERVTTDRPLLAVCLGMQLLGVGSEESPGVRGLGITGTIARRFPDTVRVPQMGWNSVCADSMCAVLDSGHAYFANSFRLTDAPEGWRIAWAEYAGPFIAAMERGNTVACQFHPELSGPWGLSLLTRWVARSREVVSC